MVPKLNLTVRAVTLLLLTAATTASSFTFETVHTFGSENATAILQNTNGDFYGLAKTDANSEDHAIFRMQSANPFPLEWPAYSFGVLSEPGGLMQGSDGAIYVTSVGSPDYQYGGIYRIHHGTNSLFHMFSEPLNGGFQLSGLLEGSDGNFYGTVQRVEFAHRGAIFKLAPSGELTTLHTFDGTNGSWPRGGLIQGSDGSLYGTTRYGGNGFVTDTNSFVGWRTGFGTVFKITTNGTFTLLHQFDGTAGAYPKDGLIQGSDGMFYGTTGTKDANESYRGTVFKMTAAGIVTTLHTLDSDEGYPEGRLVEGTNGAFYGMAARAAQKEDASSSSIFKITPSGSFTLLRFLDDIPGEEDVDPAPRSPLLLADDGYFYGAAGGWAASGFLFRMMDDATSGRPAIMRQPIGSTNDYLTPVSMDVVVSGLRPLSYQWRKNGTNISGATQPTLSFDPVEGTDSGSYSVVVTNAAGSVTSTVTVLDIYDPLIPPSIAAQPSSRTALLGTQTKFTVTAFGSGALAYQWTRGGTNISGATTSALTIGPLAFGDTGLYGVTITNLYGSITSSNAQLTVVDVNIVTQPLSLPNTAWATNVSFSVVAEGPGSLSYQWRKNGTNLVDGGKVSGAQNPLLALSNVRPSDNGSYSVLISSANSSVTSSDAILNVRPTPIIVSHPVSRTNNLGTTATFSVSLASGSNGAGYRWGTAVTNSNGTIHLTSLDNGGRISGVDTSTLTISNILGTDDANYAVIVYDGAFTFPHVIPVFSQMAKLSVIIPSTPPTISAHPSNRLLFVGSSAALNVTATSLGHISYQWFKNGTPLPGKTTSVLAVNNAQLSDSGSYTVAVTGAEMTTTSDPAVLTILHPSGKYNGLFYETNGVRNETAGFISLTTTKTNFTGRIVLEGLGSSFSGKFGADGISVKTIVRTNYDRENLTLTLSAFSTNGQLIGTLSGSGWTASVFADYYPFSTNNLATNFNGYYTMAIPGSTNGAQGPVGYSFAGTKVSTLGKLTFVSPCLADGHVPKITQPVTLSGDGQWPLHAYAYPVRVTNGVGKVRIEYKGVVLGWIALTNNAPSGLVSWIKTPWINALYSSGFTNESQAVGSAYNYTIGTRVMDMTTGKLTFSQGNLAAPFSANVLLKIESTLSALLPQTNKATVSLTAKTGIFKGGFRHPANTNIVTKFSGIILQQQNYGAGFFSSTNYAGNVSLAP